MWWHLIKLFVFLTAVCVSATSVTAAADETGVPASQSDTVLSPG
jgi:hypothetical protein